MKDLVIGMSEEERKTFVRPPSPRIAPDDEPIELDLFSFLVLRGRSDAANAWSTDRSSTLVPDQSK